MTEIKVIIDRQIAYLNAHRLQLRMRNAHSRKYSRTTRKYYFGEPGNETMDSGCGFKIEQDGI
ncbi:MAG: hypothetical protein IPK62_10785 [Bacteroidetes bacterium]|nr:hypothetical protein [Bacteroidota bacterium]